MSFKSGCDHSPAMFFNGMKIIIVRPYKAYKIAIVKTKRKGRKRMHVMQAVSKFIGWQSMIGDDQVYHDVSNNTIYAGIYAYKKLKEAAK